MSLDDQIRQALERALAGTRGHFETSLRAVTQDLARAASEERNRAVAAAAEMAATEVRQKAHAQLAQLRDAAQKHHEELRRTADGHITELKRALDEARRKAQSDLEDLRRTSQSEVEDARRLAQAQVDDVQRLMAQRLGDLEARLAEADRRATAAARETEAVRQQAAGQAEELRRRAAAEAEELIVSQLASASATNDSQLAEAVQQERAAANQLDHERTTRLVHAVRMLDDARSLGEVLEVLAQGAAREAERVAVLVARGERLSGWSLMGFGDQAPAPKSIDLDLDAAGLPGVVARTGSPASRSAADAPERVALPPFARGAASRDALALPVIVGGAAVAVLYADALASDRRGVDRWPAVLDVLARHASKVLEALTVQQVVGLSLPRPMARASHDAVAGLRHDRGVQ